MFKRNEYKLSVLRNFGTEQFSLSATVYSYSKDAHKVTKKLTEKMQDVIFDAYQLTIERSEVERKLASDRLKQRQEQEQLSQVNKKK
jgi:hypothetical protein